MPRDFNARQVMGFEQLVQGRRRVARGASLFRKDDKLGVLYVVRFGQFKLIGDGVSDQRVVGFHMPGDLIGLDAIARGCHNFRLMALEDSEVCEIPLAAMAGAKTEEPSMHRQFVQRMSEVLNQEYGRSSLLATASLEEHFAVFLLTLGERYARLGYSDMSFRLGMSRSDIGSYLGTTVEGVSRLVARFNQQGAVSIKGRMVELLDRPYLQAMVGREKRAVAPVTSQPTNKVAIAPGLRNQAVAGSIVENCRPVVVA